MLGIEHVAFLKMKNQDQVKSIGQNYIANNYRTQRPLLVNQNRVPPPYHE